MSAPRHLLLLFAALLALAPACEDDPEESEAAAENSAEEDKPTQDANTGNNAPPRTSRTKRFKPGDEPKTPPPRRVDLGKGGGDEDASDDPGADTAGDDGGPKTQTRTRKVRRNTNPNALPVDKYLKKEDIRGAVDSFEGLLRLDSFPGQTPTKTYNAMRWATEGERFGVGIQVWRPGSPQAATKRYNGLFQQSVGGKAIPQAGTPTFTSEHHKLRTVTFISNGAVTAITCDQSICNEEQLFALAARVKRRL